MNDRAEEDDMESIHCIMKCWRSTLINIVSMVIAGKGLTFIFLFALF